MVPEEVLTSPYAIVQGPIILSTSEGKSYKCELKYSEAEPLHPIWRDETPSNSSTRSTLLVRICNGQECGPWGTESGLQHDQSTCMVAGPNVVPPMPTATQRDKIEEALALHTDLPSMLRLAFHDAATFNSDQDRLVNGPNGCMRFEDIHGNLANMNIGLIIDAYPANMGDHPFSWADVYQFSGLVAVKRLGGPDLTKRFRWGRYDAPYMWCQQGDLALSNTSGPALNHKIGWETHGAGRVAERLQTAFDGLQRYFEVELGIPPSIWVALLGAHTIGRVAGLNPSGAKQARLPFDDTPEVFDNKYFKDLKLFHDSGMKSMCPQDHGPGDAHWFAPNQH
jgi:hypothetical protein